MAESPLRQSLEQELVERGLVGRELIEDAKITAAAATQTLVEALIAKKSIAEDQLLALFHHQLGFPLVDASYFSKIEPATLMRVPRDMAVEHRVLPLYLAGDKLFVAAVDPLTEGPLAEVAFSSGLQVIVCVAKTSAVLSALSQLYQAPELLRNRVKAKIEPHVEPPAPLAPPPKPRPQIIEVKQPTEKTELLELLEHQVASPEPAQKLILSLAEEYERFRSQLRSAEERDGVGRILLLFAAKFFPRVILLAHKQGLLVGWQTIGTDLTASRLKGVIIPLHLPSTFQQAVTSRTYQVGKLETTMINSAFLAAIGDSPAGHAVVIPILVEQKVAAILYADTQGRPVPMVDLSPLYKLCEDAGRALEDFIRRLRQ